MSQCHWGRSAGFSQGGITFVNLPRYRAVFTKCDMQGNIRSMHK